MKEINCREHCYGCAGILNEEAQDSGNASYGSPVPVIHLKRGDESTVGISARGYCTVEGIEK
jgi:hypothetical protein